MGQNTFAQNDNAIELVFAKNVTNSIKHENTTVAKGNVEFKHGTTRLFCDSALYFRDKDLIHAYGKVQINQADTVNLYCDSLKYDGKTKISKLISNVRFRDKEYLLLTDSLEYNSNSSIGKYKNWATITTVNSDLTLTSKKGYYYSTNKTFFFKDSVHVTDEKYELFSDTLEFRTLEESAHFHGPTTILLDSSTVECSRGNYFTKTDDVQLWNGATILEPGRRFYADSLIFNQTKDIGEGFCNVNLYDSTEQVKFLSDYLYKIKNNEQIILKENARILNYSEKDTLYLGGDTITYYQDTLTENKKTVIENNVVIYNQGLFVRCDSAYYSEPDSILKLHKSPIIWNENRQLYADSILSAYYDNKFHNMELFENAMIISEFDSTHYDQVKGKYMKAKLDSSNIEQIRVETNAQTLYFVSEESKDTLTPDKKVLMGMNKVDCNIIVLRFLEQEINSIAFLDIPTSVFTPIEQVKPKDLYLKGFKWEIDKKPSPILTD
ncbi:OstA-like protein [Crocinitomix catalasitica]|uniref:OstA-like protein n=1 Tax=Crocinitomix catalasitica TaxID=184607 RepID=UPI00048746AB|nr:OstA-like protein [Crocinitomix catalasitica]